MLTFVWDTLIDTRLGCNLHTALLCWMKSSWSKSLGKQLDI